MSPGAPSFPSPPAGRRDRGGIVWPSVIAILFATFATLSFAAGRRDRGGIVWPSVIAILFATFATLSFAVDQSVTVSILAKLPIDTEAQ
jgi:hypothetical protein